MSDRYRILITADSICDLPDALLKTLPVAVIPLYIHTDEGRFVDEGEMDTKDLLRYLDDKARFAHTEAPSVIDYQRFFVDKLMIAERIIHISMGGAQSSCYANAMEASLQLQGVKIFDSGSVSGGIGLIVKQAAEMVLDGASAERVLHALPAIAKSVSVSFVVEDMEFLDRNGHTPHGVKTLCDRLLFHPMMDVKKGCIRLRHMFLGHWESVVRQYIKKEFRMPWILDKDTLFLVHVGLSGEQLAFIMTEIRKLVEFSNVYILEASAAVSANCGRGTFGLVFAKKQKQKRRENVKQPEQGWLKKCWANASGLFANEGFPIRQRIMNLILAAALAGGMFSGMFSVAFGSRESVMAVFVMLAVVAFCLWLSIGRGYVTTAGFIMCFFANTIVFPFMYFTSGGLKSGMPIWFVLGLVFDWLILTAPVCYIMFGMNAIVMTGCIFVGERYPGYVADVAGHYVRNDVVQTIFIASCILGIVYKYQTYVYEKQSRQLKEHEEELVKSNSAKDIFLANMSHEIRTPINGIMGMNAMLLRECEDNETLMEYAKNIQSSSQMLLTIVNDILDISKIEAGGFEVVPVEYEIFSVVNDCYQIAYSRSMAKGLEFEIEFNPSIPAGLYGDEVRIRQIINNLLSNAVKYTEKGTVKLIVDMEKRGDVFIDLLVMVQDTGIGIHREEQEVIFKSFSRVDEKKNRHVEGTGLGLSLTKSLVHLMNGTISVDSIYGQGSTFTVRIPQQIKKRQPTGDFLKRYQELMVKKEDSNKMVYAPDARALVVDDVSMNLLVAKGLLKYTKMQVDTAESGVDALKLVHQNRYDIIFLDHLMPGMDGIECLHKIQDLKDNPNAKAPVIVLTANAVSGIREEYVKAGFTDYLSKPLQEWALNMILRIYLPKEKQKLSVVQQEKRILPDGGQKKNTLEASWQEKKEDGHRQTEKHQEETQPAVDVDSGAIMQALDKITMLDTAVGLKYCMNDTDFYLAVLAEYLKKDKRVLLDGALEKENFDAYRIQVHALKSTSLNIGAKQLSEDAKASEMACKEGNYSEVKERHEKLMEEYLDLCDQIRAVTGGYVC